MLSLWEKIYKTTQTFIIIKEYDFFCILDDNATVNSEKMKGVVSKQNGKTVRFQTEAEKTSYNDYEPVNEGKDKENIMGNSNR